MRSAILRLPPFCLTRANHSGSRASTVAVAVASPRQAASRPTRWDLGFIRKSMLFMGPISSLFDFTTFGIMLRVFHAGERLFQTGWFVESLATQTLVINASPDKPVGQESKVPAG